MYTSLTPSPIPALFPSLRPPSHCPKLVQDLDYYQIPQPEELYPEKNEIFYKTEQKWAGLAKYFLKNYGKFIVAYLEDQLTDGESPVLVQIYQYYSPGLRTYNFILKFPRKERDNEVQLLHKFYLWMAKPLFRSALEKEYSKLGIKLTIEVLDKAPIEKGQSQQQPVEPDVCYQLYFGSP
jgi:hypothetical protein